MNTASVTGLGGVFIKANEPKELAAWYQRCLGVPFGEGVYADFISGAKPEHTVFSFFKKDSDYFQPSTAPFMINFRVNDLAALLEKLKNESVTMVGEMQEFEYGKFGWILDPEGNKIELWEPAGEPS